MSIIRADSIKNRAGNGAPDFPNGITVTGVVTATSMSQSISGNLTVTGNGTHTYDIPSGFAGNSYHFTSGVNCGQNCNNNLKITLACSYNSSNPP